MSSPRSSFFSRCIWSSSSPLMITSCSSSVLSSIARLSLLSISSKDEAATLCQISSYATD